VGTPASGIIFAGPYVAATELVDQLPASTGAPQPLATSPIVNSASSAAAARIEDVAGVSIRCGVGGQDCAVENESAAPVQQQKERRGCVEDDQEREVQRQPPWIPLVRIEAAVCDGQGVHDTAVGKDNRTAIDDLTFSGYAATEYPGGRAPDVIARSTIPCGRTGADVKGRLNARTFGSIGAYDGTVRTSAETSSTRRGTTSSTSTWWALSASQIR
jgi:hypothetical protein